MSDLQDTRIRVAFGVDNLNLGGTELNAVRLAERLDPARFRLRVISMQGDGVLAERYRAAGIPLDVFRPGQLFGHRAAREGLRLARHLRRHMIEIFHAHDLYSNLFGCPWARLIGAKVIASRRWAGAPLPGWAWKHASRLPYRIAHVALANSPGVADMLDRIDGVPRRRIAVVPNFVDEEAFMPLSEALRGSLIRELGLQTADAVIGIVANLRPVKDHATLVRAIGLLRPQWPGLRVVLVGDGECREGLRQLADALGISRQVIFAGRRPTHPNLSHLFDIAVLCSTKEGLPNSVLEAMAAGRPVIATDVGAVSDAVVHDKTGLLVPKGSVEGLAAALKALLANPAYARRLGSAGELRARALYSPAAALGALEAVYLQLAGTRRSRQTSAPAGTPGTAEPQLKTPEATPP